MENRRSKSYYLGESREEINKIYKLSKFKRKIRLNLFLDNLVLGKASREKHSLIGTRSTQRKAALTIHYRKKSRDAIKNSLDRLPNNLLEGSALLCKTKSSLN
eukprot:TRINITY_DN1442_c0_g1_i3.p1 TRINITY_DN1442_c0_g1~~TRINITY_DN1442_c0_g1_i3.p1  ORF type:complete len:103 (+),score=18.23 TRINITY_DN1442_c0_g1_i3:105-413(+)